MVNKKILKKILSVIMMTLVTMLIGAKSYAATTLTDAKAYNLGLELVRADQYGYKISGGRIVWRIYNYAQNSDIFEVDRTKYTRLQSPKDRTSQYYCLRAEYGFLQTEATNLMYETEKYNKEYDMENANDKFAIMNILTGAGAISQTETSKYNKIMWILDNMYVPEKGNKEEIIEKAMKAYTGDKTYFPSKATNAAIYNNEELIDVVQQLAIWHYTNAEDEAYNKDTISTIFRNTNKVNTSTSFDYGEMEFKSLTDLLNVRPRIGQEEEEGSFEGTELQNEADALYQYLVKNASGSYTGAKTGTITLTGTGAKSEYSVGTKKYVVGPYTYTTSGEVTGIELNVYKELNNTETKITDKVKILDSNKQEYTGTAEGLKGKEFYVELPMTEEVDKIKVEVKGNKTKTSKKVLVGTTEGTVYQPVVKVEVEETEVKEEVETEIEKPEFDLSLRKYITKVNGKDVTETRNPEVKTSETLDKDKTTAAYNHKKDPVVVETGDVVTYRITVYNEGEVDGYAKVITDRLPSGMEYVEGQNIEGYTVAYNKETNQVTFTRTKTDNISAYTGNGTISSETIEFTCKVTKEVGTKNQVLTNIAWIAEDKNEYGIKDRDSKTEEKPNPSEGNLPGYTGKGTNKEDLTDKNYYYEGEQDDDDFEKVVIKGTTLDLNLQKYISKVVRGGETATSPRTESERYYPTIDNERHLADKKANPVVVGPKDMVIYTIKVCNQGKLAGYAKEITDVLPEGVEYITSNESGYEEGYRINEEYGWSYDANTRTAKTTYLSKENGEGNILNAYDGAKNEDDTPKYDTKYVQIAVKVKDTAKGTMLNMAAITKHSDREGNEDVDDTDSTPSNGIENENEDDTDGDVIRLPEFDLSLRKYITKVNGKDVTETRNPEVKTSETLDKDKTTAAYNHKKDPVVVETGDVVTYRITVYNEGEVDGYAKVITDRLPSGMEYVEGQNIEGYTVAYNKETNQVTFTRTKTDNISAYTGNGTISSETIEFTCKVTKEVGTKNQVLTNIAWIAEDKNEYGIKDRDSKTEEKPNPSEGNLPGYTGKGTNKEDLTDKNYYYEGEQDDDDFEKVVIKGTTLDLNLQKYISKVVRGGETATSPRTESERYYPTIDNERHLADKKANPVVVGPKDMVIYTIKVCNQGKLAGYAKEITDVLPEGVEYITSNESGYEEGYRINEEYGWSYDANTRTAKTTYLSKENGEGNILNAYDGAKNEDDTPKYDTKYVQIAVKVKDTAKGTMLNMAAITKHSDREGNEDVDDTDSTPSNGIENENEDDTDGDVIQAQQFDLSLRKYITKVNGTDVTETRNPEVKTSETLDKDKTTAAYNHRKNPVVVKTGDVVTYRITVYNEGEIDGYAKVITDKLPSGMEYIQGQSIEGYIATYNKETNEVKFERTKTSNLKAYTGNGTISSETIEFTCKVTGESSTKEQVLTNIAWIAEDKNEYGIKDRDSKTEEKPDTNETKLPGYTGKETNKKDLTDKNYYYEGEQDDDDFEKVILPAKEFDLSLKKFITEVNHKGQTREITLRDEKTRDNKKQEPVSVETGDLVTYTIRVYNEGEISGYASEITDSIPEGVKFVVDNEINKKYLWTLSEDEQTIKTTYLSKDNEIKDGENLLEAYDGKTYAYKEVKAVFEVISTDTERSIINIAEITKDTDKDGKEIDDRDSTPGNRQERTGEDDTDEEAIKLQHFDLSLKKYISKVGTDTTKTRNLETKIDEEGKITYELDKTPITVRAKDTVTYVIRIYNEGQIDGYAKEITDRLPEYLEYKEDSEVNKKYLWSYDKETNEIKTEYLSKEKEQTEGANLIKAYDKENKQIYYKEVEVECKVKEGSEDKQIINIAEITKDTDKDGKEIDDIDSTPNNKIEGEDDQDYEVIYVEYFDLSLKKFITKIGNTAINNRYPEVSKNAEGKLTYKDNKSVLEVENGDIVIYTIRVYNEGTIAGYAEEVTDRLPEGLEYIAENEINKKYGWSYNKETNEIKTEYLSKKAGEEAKRDNLINAYNKTAEVSKTNPSYKDLEVACKVSQNATGNTNLTNIAEITKDADKDGKEIEDIDSTPNNKKDGEDDIDKETLRVKIFDLSLKKFVSKVYVTEDGKTAETKTGHTGKENPEPVVKVELNRKKIKTTKVKYEYTIQVTNEGEIAGYATEVKDYVPEGLKFVKEDNPDWTENKDGSIVTRKLENKLLNPGETAEVTVILEWINGENNMGLKTNIAEISEHKDKNKNDIKDIDSTPNNKIEGEDDQDKAEVILSIKTGEGRVYYALIGTVLLTVAGGLFLIKKYVI